MNHRLAVFLLGITSLIVGSLHAAPVRDRRVETELVSETLAIQPGRPFAVGVRLKMDEHWHTYWQVSGDSGQATSIEWKLPEGFSAGPIQWPTPITVNTGGLITYNHEGEILLIVEITPPATLAAGSTVALLARVDWLVCKDVCEPGGADLALELPTATEPPGNNPARTALFASARAQQPLDGSATWPAKFAIEGGALSLFVQAPADIGYATLATGAYVFPMVESVIEPGEPQSIAARGRTVTARFTRAKVGAVEPDAFPAVISASNFNGGRAVQIRATRVKPGEFAALTSGGAGVTSSTSAASNTSAGAANFAFIALLAFVGGVILNLMPCVFPVLGIKVLGFVNQAGSDRRKVTMHGLVFTAGVLASFWALAGALLVLRSGGQQLGWGFQLQSAGFVFALAVFLLIFALNLSGLFEVGLSATGVGSSLQMRDGYTGSFFTGVLATVVATPCAAPFLAPALGAALALPAAQSLLLFTLIALGLALPYLVLSAFPSLVKLLPRPGAWMETFKQTMAFLLYATVAFLVWVLSGQLTEGFDLLFALFALVLVAMAGWAYGRWTQHSSSKRGFGYGLAILLFVSALALGFPRGNAASDSTETAGNSTASEAPKVVWQDWSPEVLAAARAEGRLIYVDFTARWCVTCQSNKLVAFSSNEVRAAFRDRRVLALKADWTNRNPAITRALAEFGRSAVPFNLIYAPGSVEPVILPELLTPGIVLDALNRASPAALATR